SRPSTRPKSWKYGIHVAATESSVVPSASSAARQLWTTLPCDSIVPLGVDVEPEVYCRYASAPGSGDVSRQRAADASSTSSITSLGIPATALLHCSSESRLAATLWPHSTSSGLASSVTLWTRDIVRPLRTPSGGGMGTAIAPP